jgi:hypothetical protein
MNIPIPISDSHREYLNHGAERWELAYFNQLNGGYVAVEKERIAQGKVSKQEEIIFNKEYDMCITLAQNGYRIEYLKITEGSFDIHLNGLSADLKKTRSHNNLVHYGKKAIKGQGAQLVVFELETLTGRITTELNKLKTSGIRVLFFTTAEKIVIDL